MAAAALLKKFQMAISPQRLTIYLYSTYRAVIFAIAQLSCLLELILVSCVVFAVCSVHLSMISIYPMASYYTAHTYLLTCLL